MNRKYWFITEQVRHGVLRGCKGVFSTEEEAERACLLVGQSEPDKFWIVFSVDEKAVKAIVGDRSKSV